MALVAMSPAAEAMARRPAFRALDRVVASFLLVLLALGSLVLWIGIPFGLLWLFSRVTESSNRHFLMSLVLIPLAMILFGAALVWLNGLYLRVTGVIRRDEEDDEGPERRVRGPLELFLYVGMIGALIALTVWFFFYARNPFGTFW